MTPEEKLPELTPEQLEAGREIAQLCLIGENVLAQYMSWNGIVATVRYGLAHSAEYMDDLTAAEIRMAVFDGIAAFQATLDSTDGSH